MINGIETVCNGNLARWLRQDGASPKGVMPEVASDCQTWRLIANGGSHLKPLTIARIVRAALFGQSLRTTYWRTTGLMREMRALSWPRNRAFRRRVVEEIGMYLASGAKPVAGEVEIRMRLAVAWLLRAQRAAGDGGVALGYFPCGNQIGRAHV